MTIDMLLIAYIVCTMLYGYSWYTYKQIKSNQTADYVYYAAILGQIVTTYFLFTMRPKSLV